jgi:hypothetical protein
MFSLLVSCTSLKNTTKEGGGGVHDAAFGSFSFVFLTSGKGNKANV